MVTGHQVASEGLTSVIPTRTLREQFGLSRERMARLLGVSTKTVERWEDKAEPSFGSTSSRRSYSAIEEIARLGTMVYTPEGFRRFLSTPFREFDGRTALQLIELGETSRVLAAIAADYEGLGY